MTKQKLEGHGAVILANVIFGLNLPVMKMLLAKWMTSTGFMTVRALFAAALFWAVSLFKQKEKVSTRDKLIIAFGALMGFVCSQYLTTVSLELTSPVYVSLIVALTPIFVMLLAAVFLKEPITTQKTIGVVLGISGAALMIFMGESATAGSNDMLGIIVALVSIVCWSTYLIVMRDISQKYSSVTQMKWTFLFSLIFLLPFGWSTLPEQTLFTSNWGWEGIAELAFSTVLATIIGYFLMPFGMRYLRATTVSVYMNLQPVVAALAAIMIGQDHLTWDKPVAAVLVMVGAYIVTTSKGRDDVTTVKGRGDAKG